jgi:hypothetical protein
LSRLLGLYSGISIALIIIIIAGFFLLQSSKTINSSNRTSFAATQSTESTSYAFSASTQRTSRASSTNSLAISFLSITNSSAEASSVSSSTSSEILSTIGTLPPIPQPRGYLGATFTSAGEIFKLHVFNATSADSNQGIPQARASGYFSFIFSNSTYSQNEFSIFYQICNGTLSSRTNAPLTSSSLTTTSVTTAETGSGSGGNLQSSCPVARTALGFSYEQDSQQQYVVVTENITLPCGNFQASGGSSLQPRYLLTTFSVQTLGQPYSYQYLVSANC